MLHVPSPNTSRYLIAPLASTHTGVCRCKPHRSGVLGSSHAPQPGGVVTSSKSLPELLLLLSSSLSSCRGRERRTSVTRDTGTLLAAQESEIGEMSRLMGTSCQGLHH